MLLPALERLRAGADRGLRRLRRPCAPTRSRSSACGRPDFAWLTAGSARIAERHCGGRVVSLLEGGYDLGALADSAAAHVRALMRS